MATAMHHATLPGPDGGDMHDPLAVEFHRAEQEALGRAQIRVTSLRTLQEQRNHTTDRTDSKARPETPLPKRAYHGRALRGQGTRLNHGTGDQILHIHTPSRLKSRARNDLNAAAASVQPLPRIHYL